MGQIILTCNFRAMLIKRNVILAFTGFWLLSLQMLFANSGSYVAAQYAELEKDFKNASNYFVDLVSRGETDSQIIKKSVIYASLANDFALAIAVSRKINALTTKLCWIKFF